MRWGRIIWPVVVGLVLVGCAGYSGYLKATEEVRTRMVLLDDSYRSVVFAAESTFKNGLIPASEMAEFDELQAKFLEERAHGWWAFREWMVSGSEVARSALEMRMRRMGELLGRMDKIARRWWMSKS
ncbi:MAG: hypothetical protein QXT73_00655 [Candidatus Methanomethylicaceae archaeon]